MIQLPKTWLISICPPRIPGINIDGLNGKAMVGGELVDKYAQANVLQT